MLGMHVALLNVMSNFRFTMQMLLTLILAIESVVPAALAQSRTAQPAQRDLWSEETTSTPRPVTGKLLNQPETTTVQILGPTMSDGSRDEIPVEIRNDLLEGQRIESGRQFELELEGGRNPAPSMHEMMAAFATYKEVADQKLMESFQNATMQTVHASKQILFRRFDHARNTFKEFPQEAFLFFWGMGAVTFLQAQWTAHKDPSVWEHFLDHQFSSVGAIGFWFFMYANRDSAAIMNAAIYGRNYRQAVRDLRAQGIPHAESTALQQMHLTGQVSASARFFSKFVPYLSMTLGFTAQNIVSTLIGDPDFVKCAQKSIGSKVRSVLGTETTAAAEKQKMLQNGFVPASTSASSVVAQSQDPCEKSYNSLVIKRKIYEAAPGLISMLGSTVVSGLVEQPVYRMVGRTYTKATQSVARLSRAAAVRLLLGSSDRAAKLLLSGAVSLVISTAKRGNNLVLASAHVISKLSNIILFTGIDVGGLNSFVTRRFRNVFEASQLGRLSSKMYEGILISKHNKWSAETIKHFKPQVQKFATATNEWRESQALEAVIAHSNWMNALNEIINRYNASKIFSETMVKEISAYKKQTAEGQSKIDRDLGVYGIKPTLISGGIDENNPLTVEDTKEYYEITLPSVRNAYQVFEAYFKDFSSAKVKIVERDFNFTKNHLEKLQPILEQSGCLKSNLCDIPSTVDLKPVDQFVDQISRLYFDIYHFNGLYEFGTHPEFQEMIKKAYAALSVDAFSVTKPESDRDYMQPIPQLNRGYWFVRAINDYSPMFKTFADQATVQSAYKGFQIRYKADYFLLSMICGPNPLQNEKIISVTDGFAPVYTPPGMVTEKPSLCNLPEYEARFGIDRNATVYRRYYPLERPRTDNNYTVMLEHLKRYIDPQYLNTNAGDSEKEITANFASVWDEKAFKPVEELLKFWVITYDDVSAELLKSIVHTPKTWVDNVVQTVFTADGWVSNISFRQGAKLPGPFSTKIKEAAAQELRVYLMILGEIFKDLANKNNLPPELAPKLINANNEKQQPGPRADAPSPLIFRRTREIGKMQAGLNATALEIEAYAQRQRDQYLYPFGWRELMKNRYEPNRVGAPLFWYLRDNDPMDFTTIARPFETQSNNLRLISQFQDLDFQKAAIASFTAVTNLFDQYELKQISRSNPSSCALFANVSFLCEQWNTIKDFVGMRAERFHEVIAKGSHEEEEQALQSYDNVMSQVEAMIISRLSAQTGATRLSNEQKLFIEEIVKRSKALGESMRHLLSMLRMNEIAAQINNQTQGRKQIQAPKGGSATQQRR